jgi:hypothetical protein
MQVASSVVWPATLVITTSYNLVTHINCIVTSAVDMILHSVRRTPISRSIISVAFSSNLDKLFPVDTKV